MRNTVVFEPAFHADFLLTSQMCGVCRGMERPTGVCRDGTLSQQRSLRQEQKDHVRLHGSCDQSRGKWWRANDFEQCQPTSHRESPVQPGRKRTRRLCRWPRTKSTLREPARTEHAPIAVLLHGCVRTSVTAMHWYSVTLPFRFASILERIAIGMRPFQVAAGLQLSNPTKSLGNHAPSAFNVEPERYQAPS